MLASRFPVTTIRNSATSVTPSVHFEHHDGLSVRQNVATLATNFKDIGAIGYVRQFDRRAPEKPVGFGRDRELLFVLRMALASDCEPGWHSRRAGGSQVHRNGRLRGGLDFAFHELANIAHGDGKIVLSLQADPELRSIAEIAAEA